MKRIDAIFDEGEPLRNGYLNVYPKEWYWTRYGRVHATRELTDVYSSSIDKRIYRIRVILKVRPQ